MKTHKTKISFRARIVALLLLCWALPMILLAAFNVKYMTSDRLQTQVSKEIQRLRYSNELSVDALEKAVELSRKASYDKQIVGYYNRCTHGSMDRSELVSRSFNYIRNTYGREDTIRMALLWYREDPENMDCAIYNTGQGATFSTVRNYWERDHQKILELSRTIDTRVTLYVHEGRLYLVRNLLTPGFENIGTLVFLLNQEYCFQSFTAFPTGTSVTLQLDGATLQLAGEPVTREETGMDDQSGQHGYHWDKGKLGIYYDMNRDGHHLTALVRFGEDAGFGPMYGLEGFFWLMILCLIPLVSMLLLVCYRHLTTPIKKMMEGAEEIELGHLGYQLDYEPPSKEFQYLADSFNAMSSRLDYQFRHIYEEELALRDARIKALQSHINPHFMNNTLEIINWEARMAGDDKVSEMIEALATLMNAGIDRKMRPVIPLSEEMVYVNAYLHIIKERFGSRLVVDNRFPEEIMSCEVPRLILQPVIENAIEHGAAQTSSQSTVVLQGRREGEFLYLEIINQSVMTEEDVAKVKRLLAPDYDTSKESSGNLGISNVNQRLRIIYGEDSGLSVGMVDEDHVMSRLTIRLSGLEERDKFVHTCQKQATGQNETTKTTTGYSKSPKKEA